MIQVVRFQQSDAAMIRKSGSMMSESPVLYRLPKSEIADRIMQAIAMGIEGFTPNDLIALDAGRLSESKLRALFDPLAFASSLVSYSPDSNYGRS